MPPSRGSSAASPERSDPAATTRTRAGSCLLLLLALALPAAVPAQELDPSAEIGQPEPAQAHAARVPVGEPAVLQVWNRDILTLRAIVGEAEPAERAERAAERIQAIPHRDLGAEVHAYPARVGRLEGLLLLAGEQIIIGIVPEDLDPLSDETLEEVGARAVEALGEVLRARGEQRQLPVILRGAALSVGATVLLVLVIWLVVRTRRRLLCKTRIADRVGGRAAVGVHLRGFLAHLESLFIKLSAASAGLFAIYLWLTFVLARFPYTEPWADRLGFYLLEILSDLALGALASIPGLFTVVVVFWLARLLVRALDGFFRAVQDKQISLEWLDPETARATRRLAVAVIWIFAVTVAYPYIPGSSSAAFKGVSVFVGLMVSLGATGFINQMMSGLVIVYSRALKPGDYVRVGENEGIVTAVGLLSTKLVTRKREELTIPNGLLVATTTVNYSQLAGEEGAIVSTTVTIGYDAPWRQVHALLLLAAERTSGVRPEPPPKVLQRSLSDFYVEYQLFVGLDRPEDRIPVLSDLHANIQDAFNEVGVQIMSPHFEAQPEAPVFVPRTKWHQPPLPGGAGAVDPETPVSGR